MKVLKVFLVTLIVGVVVFLSLSCSSGASSTSAVKTQVATVQKGSISVTVTGTGNLALENKQQLSFGQTGLVSNASNAKILDVLVTPGQTVDQDQVLVKADPTDWQDQITTDQHNLDAAKFSLSQAKASVTQAQASATQAQANVVQAQVGVTKAQNDVVNAQNTVVNAQNALQTAKYNLSMQQDVKDIQDKIDNANIQLQQAKLMLQAATALGDTSNIHYWQNMINYYSFDTNPQPTNGSHRPDGGLIGVYTAQMNQLLTDPTHSGAASSVADINAKQAAVQQAQANLDQAQANVPIVQNSVVSAQNGIVSAQNSVANAQNSVDAAQNSVITAQNRVDDLQRTLDDDKNSAQEIDAPFKGLITQVNVTKGNIVQRSASLIEIAEPDKFIANILVTERDIMSVKLSGDATVSLDALSGLNFPAKITQIAPLATISQGVVNYKITVELTSLTPTGPSTTATTQNISLKDGLSATVTITVQQKDNILTVPSKAIKNSTVQVINGSTTETRAIKTGITDSTNTEVTDGLKEGEQVLIKSSTSSSTSSNPGGPGMGGIMIP